jgi:hypothetical protein
MRVRLTRIWYRAPPQPGSSLRVETGWVRVRMQDIASANWELHMGGFTCSLMCHIKCYICYIQESQLHTDYRMIRKCMVPMWGNLDSHNDSDIAHGTGKHGTGKPSQCSSSASGLRPCSRVCRDGVTPFVCAQYTLTCQLSSRCCLHLNRHTCRWLKAMPCNGSGLPRDPSAGPGRRRHGLHWGRGRARAERPAPAGR